MESYFESQRDHIFRNVAVLIYVFDIESQSTKDMQVPSLFFPGPFHLLSPLFDMGTHAGPSDCCTCQEIASA
jgi:hypothetical protein